MPDRKTLAQRIDDAGVTMTTTLIGTEKDEDRWEHVHWKVELHYSPIRGAHRTLPVDFRMGMAHGDTPPSITEVVDILLSEAGGIENAADFEEWAEEYGYDTDSRRAEKIYTAVREETLALHRFLGDTLYDLWLWQTDRED